MTDEVRCPGCGGVIPAERLVPGMRFGCESCAGLVLEVVAEPAGVREVPFASCPLCETPLEVPRHAVPGDTMRHCGQAFALTLEYGAWGLVTGSFD